MILLSCSGTLIWAETITLVPIDIQETVQNSGSVVLSEEEALETNTVTLQERLGNDVSFSVVADRKGEAAISFRRLDLKSTAYVEDGIPLYRNANGFTDTKFTMTHAALQLNDGSGTSSFGVSPMGGEVQISSENPSKELESQFDTTFSNNDELQKLSGYHLLDTQVSYKISNFINARAGIKNLLDEAYEWGYGYPTQGRSYYVTLEWKL